MRRAAALALLAALACAAPANADHGPPATDPLVANSLQIAADYWGTGLDGCAHAAFAWPDPTDIHPARAELGGCRIYLNPDRWGTNIRTGREWCQAVVHEYGHLAGHDHGHPALVMSQPSQQSVPGCRQFEKGRTFSLERRIRTRPLRPRACDSSRSRCRKTP